jgi:hypothetical protein
MMAATRKGPLKTIYDRIVRRDSFAGDNEEVREIVRTNPGTIGIAYSGTLNRLSRDVPTAEAECVYSIIDAGVLGTRESLILRKNSPYLDGINEV